LRSCLRDRKTGGKEGLAEDKSWEKESKEADDQGRLEEAPTLSEEEIEGGREKKEKDQKDWKKLGGELEGEENAKEDQRRTVKKKDVRGCQGHEEGLTGPYGGEKKDQDLGDTGIAACRLSFFPDYGRVAQGKGETGDDEESQPGKEDRMVHVCPGKNGLKQRQSEIGNNEQHLYSRRVIRGQRLVRPEINTFPLLVTALVGNGDSWLGRQLTN